jgi:hypothetical protein
MHPIHATVSPEPVLRSADGIQTFLAARVDVLAPEGTTGATSFTLPDGRVLSVLVQTAAEAEALAAARIARAGSDLLAADARPTAHAVADALVAAGLGS